MPAPRPWTSMARRRSTSSPRSTSSSRLLGQHLVHRRDGEDAVDRVAERLPRVDLVRAGGLEPQQRGHGLEVVLDPVVDLLGEHAAQDRAPVLERDRRVVGDRGEQAALLGREGRVAVADELADAPALPAQREPDGVLARPALRPGDRAVLEDERRARRADGLDRRRSRSPRATPPGRATRRPPRRSPPAPRARRPGAAHGRRASRSRSPARPARDGHEQVDLVAG